MNGWQDLSQVRLSNRGRGVTLITRLIMNLRPARKASGAMAESISLRNSRNSFGYNRLRHLNGVSDIL